MFSVVLWREKSRFGPTPRHPKVKQKEAIPNAIFGIAARFNQLISQKELPNATMENTIPKADTTSMYAKPQS